MKIMGTLVSFRGKKKSGFGASPTPILFIWEFHPPPSPKGCHIPLLDLHEEEAQQFQRHEFSQFLKHVLYKKKIKTKSQIPYIRG